jgi:hypothetical protein
MDWIRKYRFKTLEELEPYRIEDSYMCGGYGFMFLMRNLCGLPLSNFSSYNVNKIEEKDFIKRNGVRYIEIDNWNITCEMVVNIIEDRKRKLDKLNGSK